MSHDIETRLRDIFAADAARAERSETTSAQLREGALSRVRRRRRRQVGLTSTLAVAVLAGALATRAVGGEQPPAAPSVVTASGGQATPRAPQLDAYDPADEAFFAALRPGGQGASVLRPPATLRALRDRSTVVVVASVIDVQSGGSAGGPTPLVMVTLKPNDVLHGGLVVPGQPIKVPFIGTGDAAVQTLRSQLPAGQSLWFLRWRGSPPLVSKPGAPSAVPAPTDEYALTHAYAVLAQGPEHVDTPLVGTDTPDDGFVAEARRIRSLSTAATSIQQA